MKPRPNKQRHSHQKQSKIKTKILIIDSDPATAGLLRNYLEDEKGFLVLTAETGMDGIRAAIEHTPDLILLDIRLGDMSGLEVHERLTANRATGAIPVIYVSSFFTLRTIEQATVRGARGFLSKPFNLPQIYTKVETVLRST
ncbi:response regulator [Candidatus Poribacteria bacterium]|nr:response regulator [Candidatus Poribacteria bacterium]